MQEIINFILLLVISAFHFYWIFGGEFGTDAVFPKAKGKENVMPNKALTFGAAIIFFCFGLVYLNHLIDLISFPNKITILVLAIIFLIRAIGEFRYIGFSKTIYNSKFATLDTKYYSPICLLLSLNSFYIYFYN